ncbi:SIR2 family protein [Gulosibacter sediminis]|uniref:SIR2 family protein n=1 Tax=Gulosibacter sediminis TaxID=1729695 RepID=UPI0024A90C2C|nr:SIR2 family protein [Gulosibacter sediminis]
MDWPKQLVDAIARRRAVIYLGAGASAGSVSNVDGESRPPDWPTFLKNCINSVNGDTSVIRNLLDEGDLLTACGLLKGLLRDEWNTLMTEAFVSPKYAPSETHEAVFQLDARLVATPNFDKIYDVYAQQESGQTVRISHYYDPDTPEIMRGDYRGVLKIHGTVDQPSTTIFTRRDYSRLRYEHAAFQSLINALLLTHTFFFIGTSLRDPDLILFLENHASAHPSAPVHYMTSPLNEIDESRDDEIRNDMNIKLLRYSPNDGHQELPDSLRELVDLVQSARDEIASRQGW